MSGVWVQDARRAAERSNFDGDTASKPYLGRITSVDADGEQIVVDTHAGSRTFNAPQVFTSKNSWIRSVPDSEGGVILQQAADLAEPVVLRYFIPTSGSRAAAYQSASRDIRKDPTKKDGIVGLDNWRALRAGEHHVASSGLSELYLSAQGAAELRGGAVVRGAVHDDVQTIDQAPLHQRTGLLYRHGQIGDEERLGVVRRPDSDAGAFKEKYVRLLNPAGFVVTPPAGLATNPAALAKFLVDNPPIPMSAAKEWLVNLACDGGLQPGTLFDMRVGHVFEDDAAGESDQVKSAATGNKLRSRTQYYTAPLGSVLEVDVDELGNVTVDFPLDAIFGMKVNIPTGNFQMDVTQNLTLNAVKGMIFSVVGKWAATAIGGAELSSSAPMKLTSDTTAELVGAVLTALGGAATGMLPLVNGVLTGSSLDPLTGKPFHLFGQGSTKVVAAL